MKRSKNTEKDLAQREESLKKANEQKEKVTKELADAKKKADEAKTKLDEAAKNLEAKQDDAGLKKAKEEAEKAFSAADDARKKSEDALTSANRAIELSQQSIETAKANVEKRKQAKTDAESRQKSADEALAKAKEALAQAALSVSDVHFTADSALVISTGMNQPLQLWNAKTGEPAGLLDVPVDSTMSSRLTQSGLLITIESDHKVTAWDISPKWRLTTTLGVAKDAPLQVSQSKFEDRITALAFDSTGSLLATGGGEPSRNGELLLWNLDDGSIVRQVEEAHSDTISDIEFSRDGQFLVTGAADKFVKVFKVEDGSLVRSYEGHTDHVLGVAFKADQSSLASAGADKAIKIWNVETGEQKRTINNYTKQVTSIDYVGVSDNLVSGSGDKNVKFHTASNGRNYRSFGGNNDFVYATLATNDESLVIAAGEDGIVRVWNGKDGKLLHSFAPPQTSAETAQR